MEKELDSILEMVNAGYTNADDIHKQLSNIELSEIAKLLYPKLRVYVRSSYPSIHSGLYGFFGCSILVSKTNTTCIFEALPPQIKYTN